jgi:hypothetical protein
MKLKRLGHNLTTLKNFDRNKGVQVIIGILYKAINYSEHIHCTGMREFHCTLFERKFVRGWKVALCTFKKVVFRGNL